MHTLHLLPDQDNTGLLDVQTNRLVAIGAVIPGLENAYPAGPKEKLDSTVISQPAIYVASLAALEKLRQDSGEVTCPSSYCCFGLHRLQLHLGQLPFRAHKSHRQYLKA